MDTSDTDHQSNNVREPHMDPADFTPDPDREDRCGFPEVIYAAGKSPDQTATIAARILESCDCVLMTRASRAHADAVRETFPDAFYHERSKILLIDRRGNDLRMDIAAITHPNGEGRAPSMETLLEGGVGEVCVVCAGTSDLPVAEEAALTARAMGSHVTFIRDVGVSGVHRILARTDVLRRAHAIAVIAGMEGALPSLVGGLVDVPVIAVPTSVGYGASFGGLAALLGMLNSCAGGVSVVNIDNGFGAGQIIDRINRPPERFRN